MTKVLLIQRRVRDYRVPVFNELAKHVDLTVVHMEDREITGAEFKVIKVKTKRIVFKILQTRLIHLANQFDVVICMEDYSYPQFLLLGMVPAKYKLIYWGIGVDASYNHRYDGNQRIASNILRMLRLADAGLFYSDYPVKKYSEMGFDPQKMFVANNTVRVEQTEEADKNSFLFLGSLYPQKRVDLLIEQYNNAYKKNRDLPKLVIIGDGSEREKLETLSRESKAAEKISFEGAIFDDKILAEYFSKAYMCISPDQAGLSVLKSMGCGVPYITHKDAITGGEIFNIHNGEDGILLNDFSELEQIFLEAADNADRFVEMGKAARKYYEENRTVPQMVQGFLEAIEYVLKKKG